ncbi:alpha/beta hydrolase [Luteimonas soli]|uniref:Alpha/beta hydrolase n=1 Tax=Luteimonas soli TaxID=1648966 RepID=A0ABV7XJQ1_9GAMM
MKAWFALLFGVVATPVFAQQPAAVLPPVPDPAETYLIYLHGRIVEDLGPRPTDPRFGLYDYPAILEALARRGATVISSQRPPDTNVNEYAGIVVAQVESLIHRGVPPGNIVVAGFSKGGDIAIHVSSFLRRSEVRFVLLAACWPRPGEPQLRLTGRVLSIYETSDSLAGSSCEPLARHPEKPRSFREISISTGLSHGAFYTPTKDWVDPVLDWVHGGG